MLRVFAPIVAILICSVAAAGAVDLGAPRLDDNLAARSLYDPDRFLTTSGTTIGSTRTLGLTPQVGLGYFTLGREVKTGFEESLHQVHARAGGRVDLFDFFYLSATAKLPVYTYDVTDQRLLNVASEQHSVSRSQFDLLRTPGSDLSWSGEVGLRLGKGVDLNLYYDQTKLGPLPARGVLNQPEERFGTRFIFRFK